MNRAGAWIATGVCWAVLTAAICGCAHRGTLLVWEPAAIDVTGLRRLAVLEFRGPESSGQIARHAVVTQLRSNGFYQLVDPSAVLGQGPLEEGRLSGTAGDLPPEVLAAFRRANVDAVLMGEVLSYRAGDFAEDHHLGLANLVQRAGRWGDQLMAVALRTDHTTTADVTVSLAFQLVETSTGRVLAARHSSYTQRGELRGGHRYLPAPEAALADCLHRCARDTVHLIAPHQVPVEVVLAKEGFGKAARLIRRGNQAAARGDWDSAASNWRAALEVDQENHAALYNLGIAHEAKYRFEEAEVLFAKAYSIGRRPLYAQALRRVKRNWEDYRIALAQRERRLLPELDPEPIYAAMRSGAASGGRAHNPPAVLVGPAIPLK